MAVQGARSSGCPLELNMQLLRYTNAQMIKQLQKTQQQTERERQRAEDAEVQLERARAQHSTMPRADAAVWVVGLTVC